MQPGNQLHVTVYGPASPPVDEPDEEPLESPVSPSGATEQPVIDQSWSGSDSYVAVEYSSQSGRQLSSVSGYSSPMTDSTCCCVNTSSSYAFDGQTHPPSPVISAESSALAVDAGVVLELVPESAPEELVLPESGDAHAPTFWAAGEIGPSINSLDAWVARYGTEGDVVWTRVLAGSADAWLDLAVSEDGRVAVVGASQLPFPYDLEAHFAVYPP